MATGPAAPATYPVVTIAKLLMLTERRIQQLVKEGHLPKAERGRYELVPVVQAYVRYLRERVLGGGIEGDGGAPDDKKRLMKARADIAEFEAARLAEELVPVDEVTNTWAELVSRFRARCLSIAPKAAPIVANQVSAEACHDIIETFVHEALAELASTSLEGVDPDPAGTEDRASDDSAATEADDSRVG